MGNKTIYRIRYNNFKFTKQEIPVIAESASVYFTEDVEGVYLKAQENNICGHSLFTTDKDLFEYEGVGYFLEDIEKEYKQLLNEAQNNYDKIVAIVREEKKNIPDVIDRPVKLNPADPLVKAMIADIELDSDDVVIRDKDKAKEIIDKLKQPRDKSIKAVHPEKLPKNASSMWFGNGRGWKRVYMSPEKAEKFVDAMIDAEKNLPKVNESTIPEASKEDIGKIFTHKQITEAVDNLLAEAKRVVKGGGEYYTYEDIFGKEDEE